MDGRRRVSSPHLSMVSARVSSSGAHRQRYAHSHKPRPTFPRYQLTNSNGQPGRVGEGKGEGGFSSIADVPAVRGLELWTPLSQPGSGRKPEILTKLSAPSRINKCRLQNSELKYRGPEDTGNTHRQESSSAKQHTATTLQYHVRRMKRLNDKKRRLNFLNFFLKGDLPKWQFCTLSPTIYVTGVVTVHQHTCSCWCILLITNHENIPVHSHTGLQTDQPNRELTELKTYLSIHILVYRQINQTVN